MKRPVKVLIIENEALVLDSFKRALKEVGNTKEVTFSIQTVHSSELARHVLGNASTTHPFGMLMLNLNIPPIQENKTIFIEDLCVKTRETFPNIKIMAFASQCSNYRINSVLKTLNPESFLIKSDIDFEELKKAIHTVLKHAPYYSKVVLKFIRRTMSCDYALDQIDRSILYYLSKGIKTKDLTQFICLSHAGIQKRKRLLKDLFNVSNCNDSLLLKSAQDNGLI